MAETIRIQITDSEKSNNPKAISSGTATKYEKSAERSKEITSGMMSHNTTGIDSINQLLNKYIIEPVVKWLVEQGSAFTNFVFGQILQSGNTNNSPVHGGSGRSFPDENSPQFDYSDLFADIQHFNELISESITSLGVEALGILDEIETSIREKWDEIEKYTGEKCSSIKTHFTLLFDKVLSKVRELPSAAGFGEFPNYEYSPEVPSDNRNSSFTTPQSIDSPSIESDVSGFMSSLSDIHEGFEAPSIEIIANAVFEKDGADLATTGKVLSTLLILRGVMSGLNDWADASNPQYDRAERKKKERDTGVKAALLIGGTAIGAVLGQPLIGAAIGGAIADFGGGGISDWLGEKHNTEDYQKKILSEMRDDLKSAVDEYSTITSSADYAKGLIQDYKDIEKLMDGGTLNFDELEDARKKLEDISKKLKELFPEFVTDYDLLTGNVSKHVDSIEEAVNLKVDKSQSEYDISYETVREQVLTNKLPENLESWNKETSEAREKSEKANEYRRQVFDIWQEWKKEVDNNSLTFEESDQMHKGYIEKVNQLTDDYGQMNFIFGFQDLLNKIDSGEYQEIAEKELTNFKFADEQRQKTEETAKIYYDETIKKINEQHGPNSDVEGAMAYIEILRRAMDEIQDQDTGELSLLTLSDETLKLVQQIMPELNKENMEASEVYDALNSNVLNYQADYQDSIDQVIELNEQLGALGDKRIEVPIYLKMVYSSNTGNPDSVTSLPTGSGVVEAALNGGKTVKKYASGGILSIPHLGLVAEDGPESIIPLSGKRRNRGIDLWKRTGELLGVSQYADGAILGLTNNLFGAGGIFYDDSSQDDNKVSFTPIGGSSSKEQGKDTQLNLAINPVFNIKGNNPENIAEQVKSQIIGMVDDITNKIADNLEVTFSNMPIKA